VPLPLNLCDFGATVRQHGGRSQRGRPMKKTVQIVAAVLALAVASGTYISAAQAAMMMKGDDKMMMHKKKKKKHHHHHMMMMKKM
jgi:heme A synthase